MSLRVLLISATLTISSLACSRAEAPAAPPKPETSGAPPSGLLSGFGSHHHPFVTSSAEAQRFFDQGFALVFGFNHEEAVRSFQRAAELDPKSPMPHWGIAWALGPNYNLDIDDPRAKQAFEEIEKAKMLAASAPPQERAYVDALAVRYSPDPKADRAALARKYSAAIRALSQSYPDDLDAATLYAESLMNLKPWKLWTLDGKPADGTLEIVSILESVLRRDPNHMGANHYYIHSVEASTDPARALASAKRLESLAPSSGHLVHMPAHIYARTGDQAGAAQANLAGANADRVYLKTAPADSFYGLAYYSHNLHFLADSEMMRGRLAEAKKAAAEVAERLAPHTQMMPMVESLIGMQLSVLLRFALHDEVLAAPQPPAAQPVSVAWWHFGRGVALARSGRPDEAAAERKALDATLAMVPEQALFGGTGLVNARTVLGLAGTVLDARIAWARGSHDQSVQLWTKAVAAADRLPYDEPPVWFYPLRESLGAALLQAGKAGQAEKVFREDLVRHPRNARSLFGLRESLVKQGKDADAAWVQRAFEEAWKNADTKLTIESL